MRILQRESNQVFDSIEIFLTFDEAEEMRARLSGLIDNPESHHIHLDTDEENNCYKKELIIAIYNDKNLDEFDSRSKKLILEDS